MKKKLNKLIKSINHEQAQIQKLGFKPYQELKFQKDMFLFSLMMISAPVLFIISTIFYTAWELTYFTIHWLSFKTIERDDFQRDANNSLYRNYYFKNYTLKFNKPFLVWTYLCPRWFQPQGFWY